MVKCMPPTCCSFCASPAITKLKISAIIKWPLWYLRTGREELCIGSSGWDLKSPVLKETGGVDHPFPRVGLPQVVDEDLMRDDGVECFATRLIATSVISTLKLLLQASVHVPNISRRPQRIRLVHL